MNRKIKLIAVPVPDAKATIYKLTVIPAFKGAGHEDLLCANCAAVLSSGVPLAELAKSASASVQWLLLCPCGTHNRLPTQTNA